MTKEPVQGTSACKNSGCWVKSDGSHTGTGCECTCHDKKEPVREWIKELEEKLVNEYWFDVVSGRLDMKGRVREFYEKALKAAYEKGRADQRDRDAKIADDVEEITLKFAQEIGLVPTPDLRAAYIRYAEELLKLLKAEGELK